jgi:hypothetical protein
MTVLRTLLRFKVCGKGVLLTRYDKNGSSQGLDRTPVLFRFHLAREERLLIYIYDNLFPLFKKCFSSGKVVTKLYVCLCAVPCRRIWAVEIKM